MPDLPERHDAGGYGDHPVSRASPVAHAALVLSGCAKFKTQFPWNSVIESWQSPVETPQNFTAGGKDDLNMKLQRL